MRPVSRRLFAAVALAVDVARRTGGLVDPTVGRALRLAGYDRTFVAVRARDGRFLAISHRSPGWGSVRLDPERLEIRVPLGVELDLGATAKASAADAAAAAIYRLIGAGVLVSLGGDVSVAGPVPVGGWPIRISDHHDAPLASAGPVVAVAGGGLATSGVAARSWRVSGGERHHIIDPRTGGSALTPWRTVTVTGATCLDANAASTAAARPRRRCAGLARAAGPLRTARPSRRLRRVRRRLAPNRGGGRVIGAAGPTTLWYLTRGTGVVSLVLLTASVVLGVAGSLRARPRALLAGLHRNVPLLAIAFVVAHVLTTVADGYAPIGVKDAVLPFLSPYRPVWLGLGTVAFDLLLALVATSLLRARIGLRGWRAVHWLAYLSWPVAVMHGLGTGSDGKSVWLLVLTAACTVAVAGSVVLRVVRTPGVGAGRRLVALTATPAVLLILFVWAKTGPLQRGWALRAGTPTSLIPAARGSIATNASAQQSAPATPLPYTATVSGSLTQSQSNSSGSRPCRSTRAPPVRSQAGSGRLSTASRSKTAASRCKAATSPTPRQAARLPTAARSSGSRAPTSPRSSPTQREDTSALTLRCESTTPAR